MRTQFTIFQSVTYIFRALIRLLQNQLTLRMEMYLWQFFKFAFTVITLLQVILTMALEYDEQKLPVYTSSIYFAFFFLSHFSSRSSKQSVG